MQQENSSSEIPFPTHVLEEGLREHYGRSVKIVDVQVRPLAVSSHPIARVTVTLASGESLPVIFKRLHPGEQLYGNEREVLIYRSVLKGGRFGAPALYASVYDAQQGRYELFLEDIGDSTLDDAGISSWIDAARWLAQMHATYLGREDELRALGCLMEHDAAYYERVIRAARRNLELAGAVAALPRFDDVIEQFAGLIAHVVSQPRTLVHGDLFGDHVMVQPGRRIRAMDWESAAIGLGAWDLARLLDGWGSKMAPVLSAYLEELEGSVGRDFDREAFERTFAYCKILNVLWHLRWSVDACRHIPFVESELDKLETLWEGWPKEPSLAEAEGAGRDG